MDWIAPGAGNPCKTWYRFMGDLRQPSSHFTEAQDLVITIWPL
jgi:hypothetical protein